MRVAIQKWFQESIRFKLVVMVLLVASVCALTSAVIISRNERRLWEQFLQEKGRGLSAYIADISKEAIVNKDYIQLDNIVKKINNDPEIVYAAVYDQRGTLLTSLFASVNLKMPAVEKVLSKSGADTALPVMLALLKSETGSKDVTAPVTMDGEPLGKVVISLSPEKVREGVRQTMNGIIFANFLALCIALLLLSTLQGLLTKPIVRLSRLMAEVSQKKDYALRAEVQSRDEVGVLAKCFNEMLEQINARDKELKAHRDTLQGEVAHRTAQLKTAQEQLLQSEKMATVGQLAAGVAHEINNPAGFVMSNLDVLKGYTSKLETILTKYEEVDAYLREQGAEHGSEQARQLLQEVAGVKKENNLGMILEDLPSLTDESLDGMQRIRRIVMDLKSFARTDEGKWEQADIHDVIHGALNIAWNEIKYKADVVKEYGPVPKVRCYPQQLSQVFLNLFVNAAQAIPVRGKIIIRTFMDGDAVIAEVSDTGSGMPEAIAKRVFEPFFTTKPVGKGTGLGLSLAYNIIEKHEGKISVTSRAGEGTTFRIRLPQRAV
ncbi:MAG: HAMP domain-containing protein [Candidatus Omnitrophica bacterium]|nr:HAMP domain-containing protein [Candidatus Omnitrophota bacterium]